MKPSLIPSPAWLARRLRTPRPTAAPIAEPKPVPVLATAEPIPAPPIRVSPPPDTRPPRTWINAELTDADVYREELVLAELADLTAELGDPRAAATRLFGGGR